MACYLLLLKRLSVPGQEHEGMVSALTVNGECVKIGEKKEVYECTEINIFGLVH
jgi:hypothetical protein